MSGSFTLTGKLMLHDKVTPIVDAPITLSAASFPDTTDKVLYSQGANIVSDADGTFSESLLTETGLVYTVTSESDPPLFSPFTFTAPADGSTVDLTDLMP